MNEATRQIIVDLLDRRRGDLLEGATDWVRSHAVDIHDRPREETRALVDRVISTQTVALLEGDDGPLDEFIDFVTSLRASSEFHVSTVLRGLLSFRAALEDVLRREVADGWAALDVLAALDQVSHRAVCRAADVYSDKLNRTVVERRAELEEDLERTREAKERELDEKIRTIEAQREALSVLAAPVIRVWEGVLVVPLIGDIDAYRADAIRERVLQAVVATRSRMVICDITGLAGVDEGVVSEIVRLIGCVQLLGSNAMLVGVSPEAALVLAGLDLPQTKIQSHTTLHDGLRAVLGEDAPAERRGAAPSSRRGADRSTRHS